MIDQKNIGSEVVKIEFEVDGDNIIADRTLQEGVGYTEDGVFTGEAVDEIPFDLENCDE